jgi:hypothetical protein
MLTLGEGDVRERLKERGGQPLIESVMYRKILCLRHGAIMDKGVRTKLTGDKAHEKLKVKKSKASKPTAKRDKKVQDSGFESHKNAHELNMEPIDLPGSYGETRAVLMAIEPYLLHVYWEVTLDELEKARHWFDDDHAQSQTILRFYDVTNAVVDHGKAHNFFDVDIDLYSRSRYVHLWSPDKSCFVELGFKTEDGRFFPLVRSNVAKTPSAWPAPKVDEQDTAVPGNLKKGSSKAVVHEDRWGDATIKAGDTERQAKRQKEQKPRRQGESAQEMDSPQTAPPKLARPFEFPASRKSPFQPDASLKERVQGQSEKRVDLDMTEMNEQALALGVSSERGASPQKKKDSADS